MHCSSTARPGIRHLSSGSVLQVKGAEKVLYGLDDVAGQSTIVVVEGGWPAVRHLCVPCRGLTFTSTGKQGCHRPPAPPQHWLQIFQGSCSPSGLTRQPKFHDSPRRSHTCLLEQFLVLSRGPTHDWACLPAGEMDKLALEEAGLLNVVSVPDGAPRQVKEGELPPQVRSIN